MANNLFQDPSRYQGGGRASLASGRNATRGGFQDYMSYSKYGEGLTDEQKAEHIKKLSGEDYNALTFGKTPMVADMYNKAANGLKGFSDKLGLSRFGLSHGQQNLVDVLKRDSLRKAYDKTIRESLFKDLKYTDDEFKKNVDEHGGYAGTKGWDKWVLRENQLTGEKEWTLARDRETESNFWRRYKKPIIQGAAGVGGFLVGGPAGALAAASLAGTIRDAYAAHVDREKIEKAQEKWKQQQKEAELAAMPTGGRVQRQVGEGVVSYNTKDIGRLRKGDIVTDRYEPTLPEPERAEVRDPRQERIDRIKNLFAQLGNKAPASLWAEYLKETKGASA